MLRALIFLFLLVIVLVAARWYLPIGPAEALDGDTLAVGRQRIDLYGIEAPQADQFCGRFDGNPATCGAQARRALAELVRDRYLLCLPYDRSWAGVYRGVCWADGINVGEALVRAGLAAAEPMRGTPFLDAERVARDQRRGMWQPRLRPVGPPAAPPEDMAPPAP